ncbi:MAG: prolipoprotein diacylglyceryl transferase [Bacilli bacterium]|nr:prolipoprotein diacylglyceryl transferase [Bacilli bacterium]
MNPIALDLGYVTIYWYSIFIFLAFLIGGTLALNESRKWRISEDFMINLFFYLIISAMIGARLYYVAFNTNYYVDNPLAIFKVWEGGLAIHGGIIFGLLTIILYTKKYKVNTIRIIDILVVSLILGQAIGRWGNFFNGEAHGAVTTLETLQAWHLPQFIINGMNINGIYYIPTFLIESIWCLIGFVILLIIRNNDYVKLGQVSCTYMIWYGIGRFFIEMLRTDSLMLGNFKVAQIVSLIMIVIGVFLFIKIKRTPVFTNNYNDLENTNIDRF